MRLFASYRSIASSVAVNAFSAAAEYSSSSFGLKASSAAMRLHDGSEPASFFRAQGFAIPTVCLPVAQPFFENRVTTEFVFPDCLRNIGEEHLFRYV